MKNSKIWEQEFRMEIATLAHLVKVVDYAAGLAAAGHGDAAKRDLTKARADAIETARRLGALEAEAHARRVRALARGDDCKRDEWAARELDAREAISLALFVAGRLE